MQVPVLDEPEVLTFADGGIRPTKDFWKITCGTVNIYAMLSGSLISELSFGSKTLTFPKGTGLVLVPYFF
jgi:hypothetical protein